VKSNILLQFTRFPEPGKVKTRLIAALGQAGACSLHRRLTSHMMQVTKNFSLASNADLVICFDGADAKDMQQLFGKEFNYLPQSQGDLGRRLSAAFVDFFARGHKKIVLIGSDCPGISAEILAAAFSSLNQHDLVLGPATDGGYYLIGLTAWYPELFQDVSWGTAEVLPKTTATAASLGLATALLEPLSDIDRPEDLPVLEKFGLGIHA
jgi:rSAM/selenodomain-associated transferase 1